ncbi:hypothetical protein PsorP6_017656 [Peronosclerospora sorghi]|uniref:Uncharacterized protein n=1 Tax=Peronosclerospora sorghi TaxID=230839 RepID=A0ACC0WKF7_9STRA|nr:hypothetical protein PsorP6_017656 [Peronosclerospora sorghi]
MIKFDLLVLILGVVLLARLDPVSALQKSILMVSGAQGPSLEVHPRKRRLRAHDATTSDKNENEARVFGWEWLKRLEQPYRFELGDNKIRSEFALFQLDKKTVVQEGKIDETLVLELFHDPSFELWIERSLNTNELKQSERDSIIVSLLLFICQAEPNGRTGYPRVAHMIYYATQSRETASLAKQLEQVQFRTWTRAFQTDLEHKAKAMLTVPEKESPDEAWKVTVLKRYARFVWHDSIYGLVARIWDFYTLA